MTAKKKLAQKRLTLLQLAEKLGVAGRRLLDTGLRQIITILDSKDSPIIFPLESPSTKPEGFSKEKL